MLLNPALQFIHFYLLSTSVFIVHVIIVVNMFYSKFSSSHHKTVSVHHYRISSLSSICVLLYVICIFLSLSPIVQSREYLLLFGDSIDRMALYHYCEQAGTFHGNYRMLEWNVNHTVESHLSAHCVTHAPSNDILAFVHLFGSQPEHPYMHVGGDDSFDTSYRIPLGLRLFREKFGTFPTRILFHTTKWEKGSPYLFDKHIIRESPNTITNIAIKRQGQYNIHIVFMYICHYLCTNILSQR